MATRDALGLKHYHVPVFGDPRLPARFWAKVRLGPIPVHRPELGPCWEWTGAHHNKGYGYFTVGSRTEGNRQQVYAHRFAYEALIAPIPDGLESDHLCRNHPCIRPTHIEPVTRTLNSQRGLQKGETHTRAKLTEENIREIRRLRGIISQRQLAARFGVLPNTISRIQLHQRWFPHLPAQAYRP